MKFCKIAVRTLSWNTLSKTQMSVPHHTNNIIPVGPELRMFDLCCARHCIISIMWPSVYTPMIYDWCYVTASNHDDVMKWKHFLRHWPFVQGIHWSPVNSPHIGQSRGALMFSLICAWTNGWINNRGAGDLRRHRTHYDVTVMSVTDPMRAYRGGPRLSREDDFIGNTDYINL